MKGGLCSFRMVKSRKLRKNLMVLAEKLETVISRNVTNTRMRDFYDIHIFQQALFQ